MDQRDATRSADAENPIDAVPAVLWRADAQTFQFTFVSSYAEKFLGYPRQRWTDEPSFWKDHVHADDREPVLLRRAEAVQENRTYTVLYRMTGVDGQELRVREIGRIAADGNLAGLLLEVSREAVGNDALSASGLTMLEVVDAIPQQIWSAPASGSLDFFNARMQSESGRNEQELQGDSWQDCLHPDDRDRVIRAWRDSVVNGTPYENEARHKSADGGYRWFLTRGSPLKDNGGHVVRWFGTHTDIQTRKRIESELRQSEERWRAALENSYVGIGLIDDSGRFIAANAAYETMLGYSRAELKSMSFLDLTHEEDRAAIRLMHDELLRGERTRFELEKRSRRQDGAVLWVRVNGSALPARPSEPRITVVFTEDVTERKRLHDDLVWERNRLRLLLDLTHLLVAGLDASSVIDAVLVSLDEHADWQIAAVILPEPATDRLKVYRSRGAHSQLLEGATLPVKGSLADSVYRSAQPVVFRSSDIPSLPADQWLRDALRDAGMETACLLPLVHGGHVLGVMFLGARIPREFAARDLDSWQELAHLVAAALNNALSYDHLRSSHERLASEKGVIEEQVRGSFDVAHIIGRSQAMHDVLQRAYTVASTDSTVLVLGETGTGKELIARAIHEHSSRRAQAFIKIDCAAIPASLMESELFGHEKGAFTGAIAQKLGRLEIAQKGTLFLDEVAEIPLELQGKLLRVLQEQEFERVGSNRTQRLDVRIIAATNRDLDEMIGKREFRADLYYRLKVFPITIPPLRERPDDIEPLVWHYVRKYSQMMRKPIERLPAAAMGVFKRYPWPGNVRELQHFIERCVILTSGPILWAPLRELEEAIRKRQASNSPPGRHRTMEDIERESILSALRQSNWIVGGPNGAAVKLGLKRTTLASRMERLRISRPK